MLLGLYKVLYFTWKNFNVVIYTEHMNMLIYIDYAVRKR